MDTEKYKDRKMNLRFLKKKDGTKILQEQQRNCSSDSPKYIWADVPLVEEKQSATDRLTRALDQAGLWDTKIVILVSRKFYDELNVENNKIPTPEAPVAYFCGNRVYPTSQNTDFKLLKEI